MFVCRVNNTSGWRINENGQIIGNINLGNGLYRSFLNSNGSMIDLDAPLNSNKISAYDINDAGQVIANFKESGFAKWHSFLYSNGSTIDLGTLGGNETDAYDINNAGQIVGVSTRYNSSALHAVLYSNGKLIELGSLGGIQNWAYKINDAGMILGQSELGAANGFGISPFIYTDGTMYDLNKLLGPSSEWIINDVYDINELGDIAVVGKNKITGHNEPLLLKLASTITTPVPEPTSIALLSLGLACLYRHRRRWLSCQSA